MGRGVRYPVLLPEIIDIDVLGTYSDEELSSRLRGLEDDRQRLFEMGYDARPWEEEVAFVRREQQIRRGRRDRHDTYVRRLEYEFAREEARLPFADLDNSRFLELFE